MNDGVSYAPLIDDMIWSYSRIEAYEDCPYRFFLKYIKRYREVDKFYSSYGSFMHKIIERYYTGELKKSEMLPVFLADFKTEVRGMRPKESTVEKYINAGCDYLKGFEPFPFNTVAVEKKVKFKIGDKAFIGFIDYIGEKAGKLYVIDNKSRALKPRSGRARPTRKDEELNKMLTQLYLYSVAVEQEYGVLPEALCFNCFKVHTFIKEPFDREKFIEAQEWALNKIEEIRGDNIFEPNREYFSCRYICGVSDRCIYDIEAREEAIRNKERRVTQP